MTSLVDLVSKEELEQLATPAKFRLGEELAKEGAVELLEFGPRAAKAFVKGRQRGGRSVELYSRGGVLSWDCTCNKNREQPCQHVVATGLAIRKKAHKKE